MKTEDVTLHWARQVAKYAMIVVGGFMILVTITMPFLNANIKLRTWLDTHHKLKQWLWFVTLWCSGLCTTLILTAPLKWLVIYLK